MSIANELSSEVAVWLLAQRTTSNTINPTPTTAGALRQVVLELHTTLQNLKREERAARRLAASATGTPLRRITN